MTRLRIPLLVNSVYLLAGRFGSTFFLFIFWALVARQVAPDQVGLAISANAAVTVIALLTDLGLSNGVVRFTLLHPDSSIDIVNTSIAAGWMTSLLGGLIFLVGIPLWSPGLVVLRHTPIYAVGFVMSILALKLLNLQSAALLAKRRGDFTFWRFNLASIGAILVFLLAGSVWQDSWGVFFSYNLPSWLLVLISSLVILPALFPGYRAAGHFKAAIALMLMRFAGANYFGSLLWEMPVFLLPLMATNLISPTASALFYMPWMIGLTVLAIPQMVSTNLFVEGSRETGDFLSLGKKSAKFILVIMVPAVVVLWIWGGIILQILGEQYVNMALLRVILLSAFPYAVNMILLAYFRVSFQLNRLVWLSVIATTFIFGLAFVLSQSLGILGLGYGWLLGQCIAAVLFGSLTAYQVSRPAAS